MGKVESYTGTKKVFKTIYKVVSKIILYILILIALFLLYVGVSTKLYKVKGDKFKPVFSLYSIISPSMYPTIKVYDIIIDKKVDSPTEIKEGDIITFLSTSSYSQGLTVTHRVTEVRQKEDGNYEYQTKGDNNLSPDAAYAPYENVLGKVVFRVPQFGRVQDFLANRHGWILVVIIPALIIIIKDILKLSKLAKVESKVSTMSGSGGKKTYRNSSSNRKKSIARRLDK